MSEKQILKQLDKYYIYAVSSKKPILLASSNSKTDLRVGALEKLELNPSDPESTSQERINKYNGLYLYRIKLMKVPKTQYDQEKNSKIKMIGGPIVAIVERVQINVGEKIKLKSADTVPGTDETNNKIYFSQVYLKKYETIKPESIDSIAFKFAHKKFNLGLFAVNTLNE
jgi:hypothetical protein